MDVFTACPGTLPPVAAPCSKTIDPDGIKASSQSTLPVPD